MQSRILVVEDDHLQQFILKAALAANGHEVEICSNGLDAVWMIREGRFDLVLLDYQLPQISGLATARLIGDFMGEVARPRLIALTATPDSVTRWEMSAGRVFDEVVSKSVDLPELLATVTRHLRSATDGSARQIAGLDLLIKEWARFDVPPERPTGQSRPAALARVLVIEDDEVQRSVLKAALETQGYDVEEAPDGLSGVRKMRESGFDLALIDYELPEIDGLATAWLIGDLLSDLTRPRLLALTAASERLASRAVPHRMFDEVVAKQVGLPVVLATVARHLRSAPNIAKQCATTLTTDTPA